MNEITEYLSNIEYEQILAESAVCEALYQEYQKQMILMEQCENNDMSDFDIFTEADGSKKASTKNKFVATIKIIVDKIKQFIGFIIRQLNRLVTAIKNLFKDKKKSTNQILDEMGVEKGSVENRKNKNITSTESVNAVDKDGNEVPDMEILNSDIIVKYIESSNKITFKFSDIHKSDKKAFIASLFLAGKDPGVFGKHASPIFAGPNLMNGFDVDTYPKMIFSYIKLDIASKLIECLNEFVDNGVNINTITVFNRTFISIGEKLNEMEFNGEMTVSFDEIMQLKKDLMKIEDLSHKLIDITPEDNSTELSFDNYNTPHVTTSFTSIINQVFNVILSMQMGFNTIERIIKNHFIVSDIYENSIKDIQQLSEFTYNMIKNGVPTKYVRSNAFYVTHPSISGKNKFKPVMGQTRTVFFPPNKDIVYKVSMNIGGINANKNEEYVTSKFEKIPELLDKIVPVSDITSNKTVLTMKKIKPGVSMISALNFLTDITLLMTQHNVGFTLDDIHNENIGIDKSDGNKMKCFDYGLIKKSL